MQGDFDRYKGAISVAPVDEKTALMQNIKRGVVFPNFEDIATERLTPQISSAH